MKYLVVAIAVLAIGCVHRQRVYLNRDVATAVVQLEAAVVTS